MEKNIFNKDFTILEHFTTDINLNLKNFDFALHLLEQNKEKIETIIDYFYLIYGNLARMNKEAENYIETIYNIKENK